MASRPALAPLLDVLELSCRCAPTASTFFHCLPGLQEHTFGNCVLALLALQGFSAAHDMATLNRATCSCPAQNGQRARHPSAPLLVGIICDTGLGRPALAFAGYKSIHVPFCRRLHEVAMPTGMLEPPPAVLASPQAAHEATAASLVLAVLVRLTAHAGALLQSSLCWPTAQCRECTVDIHAICSWHCPVHLGSYSPT